MHCGFRRGEFSRPISALRRLPAHVVSLGRVLLANLSTEDRDSYLANTQFKPFTPRTIIDPKRLADELRLANERGYAWVDGELDPAICGIAVPIRDQSGSVAAAISVNLISGTMNEAAAKKRYLVRLKKTAQDIRTQAA